MSSAISNKPLDVLNFGAFTEVVQFLMELDKLKSVYRKNKLLNRERHENTAEHSWQFAVAAMAFAPYVPGVNLERAIKLALVHDIVEIDAGDVLVFDNAAREAIHDDEVKAANRLFNLLPSPQNAEFLALWNEYDAVETLESKYANAIDRAMPMLLNLHNQGQSWVENHIRHEQVVSKCDYIQEILPEFWLQLKQQLEQAHQKGWLL
ncbi:HD domain-containing protein [Providencia sp. PROV188]|jgi:putative hydrolase of HD superfamily|uniref:HD domain-containing protein n=1 Tax=Providencia TaxID=586 RepID=UPI0003E25A8A|nr:MULTISPECIES: HD domain-containing protein [Providencia]ETT01103.1 HD domain protein [Providencia alcalifaciens PAL-3]EUC98452.1 HD domain protein [Providencia alcalifaciens PAL-1]MBG5882872.1 HD domain-containing protein [Providencia alcalifaciens]MDR2241677.1 HD domain-containing protein [Providencia alcalifaciens]MDR2988982.1 HD domain-containing protein [Providencia alcalifaciens]